MKLSSPVGRCRIAAAWALVLATSFTAAANAEPSRLPLAPVRVAQMDSATTPVATTPQSTTVPVAPPVTAVPPAKSPATSTTPVTTPASTQSQPQPGSQTIPRGRNRGRLEILLSRLQFGVRPTYSNLISSKTRKSFGEGGFSIRPTFFRLRIPSKHHEFGPDYGYSRSKLNDNRMTMLSLGAGYRYNVNVLEREDPNASDEEKADRRARIGSYPYIGVGLNLVATKLRVPDEDIDTGFKLGLGASLTAGYQYKTRMRLQAVVTGMSSVSGYNFSSVRVGLDCKL